MPKYRVCSEAGCGVLHTGKGKCDTHTAITRAVNDKQRRPDGNPYTSRGHQSFRSAVLARDTTCVLCGRPSTVADHYPIERRDLIAQGLNPDDPEYGRGLCKPCHDRHTGATSRRWMTQHDNYST